MKNILQFNSTSLRNFLSFGDYDTTIDLRGQGIVGIVGENLDTGGNDSRNGTGKSTLSDALSYCLFGKTPRGISNNKLRHKFARQGQATMVTTHFSIGKHDYLVERGESPAKLTLFRKPIDSDDDFKLKEGRTLKYNITRSSKVETTKEIVKVLGFDFVLFEYLIVNSSESTPFLKLSEDKRREVSESLLGFSLLTERANVLKEQRKEHKKDLISIESAYNATVEANNRVEQQIRDLEIKKEHWDNTHSADIDDIEEDIKILSESDPDADIKIFKQLEELNNKAGALELDLSRQEASLREITQQRRSDQRELDRAVDDLTDAEADIITNEEYLVTTNERITKLETDIEHAIKHADDAVCPTCGQDWVADENELEKTINAFNTDIAESKDNIKITKDNIKAGKVNIKELKSDIKEFTKAVNTQKAEDELSTKIDEINASIETLDTERDSLSKHEFVYEDIEEAMGAGASLDALAINLKSKQKEVNSYIDTIDGLKQNAIKKLDNSEIVDTKLLIEHFNFLISLLLDKDSYVRKEIIKVGLPELNRRIHHHLQVLGLPHDVKFNSELSVIITLFDEEWEFGNLSKGERQRLNIAINFSFQDIFEFLNYRISVTMIDEMIDSGIDSNGARNALADIKTSCIEKNKKIFLVTHRDDILSQLDDVLLITKQNEESSLTAI